MQALQNPYLKQNPTSLGQIGENNSPFLSVEDYKINLDYSNYLRQSGLEALGRTSANIGANTALEAIRGVGSLYELGKRGVNLVDKGDFSINNLLFGNFDKDDNDFGNTLTKFADKNQNPFGQVYTRSSDTFDLSSPAWWMKQMSSTLPTVLEFAGESLLLGSGIAKAGLKLAEFANLGVKGAKGANTIAQGLTSFLVTKHESYMMAGQTYDKVYKDYLDRFSKDNPLATEEELKAIEGKAKEAAANAASYTDGIYTALALPFNVTGLSSIFSSKGDDIYNFFKKGVGSKLGKEELDQLSTQNPFVAKLLGKEKALNGTLLREANFEGIEELEGQFAQEAGERNSDKRGNINSALDQLGNFFKYTLNEEGALNYFMGSFMGGTQTALLENLPVHKVTKLNFEGKPDVIYNEQGEPVVQKQWVNSRTRDVYGKQQLFDNYRQAISHDLNHVASIQDQIAKSKNPIEREELKRQLFHLQAFDSVKKGVGENLINSIKQIVDIDNTKSIVEDIKPQIDQLDSKLIPFTSKEQKEQYGEEIDQLQSELEIEEDQDRQQQIQNEIDSLTEKLQYSDDEKVAEQNEQIKIQKDQLTKDYLNNKDQTQATSSGIAKNKEDNDYKERGNKAIEHIKRVSDFYDKQKDRFGNDGLQVAEYATELYSNILGREQVEQDFTKDIENEKANIGMFANIDNLAELDSFYQLHSFTREYSELEEINKAIEKYKKNPTKENQTELEKFVDSTSKDTWNTEELASALESEQQVKLNSINEKNELIRSNIRNTQAYQDYLKGQEDSNDKLNNYIQDLNSKSKDLGDFANLTSNLDGYKQKTQFLKDRLTEITSPKGSERFIKNSIQKIELAKKLLQDKINTLSYEQAKTENQDYFFTSKIRKLNVQHIEVIEKEIDAIKDKVKELKVSSNTKSVKTYFDSFLERFSQTMTKDQIVKAYENRLDQLESYKLKVIANENSDITKVEQATTQTEKAKIVTSKEEQVKFDIENTVNVEGIKEESLFDEDEFVVSENQEPEVEQFVEPQVIQEPVLDDEWIVSQDQSEEPEVKEVIQEAKQEVKVTRDSSKELIDYISTINSAKPLVDKVIKDWIERIQTKEDLRYKDDIVDKFAQDLNSKLRLWNNNNTNSKVDNERIYQTKIKVSSLLYDLTGLDNFNQSIKIFEVKLDELIQPQIKFETPIIEDVVPDIEENPIENIVPEQEKIVEQVNNKISQEIIPNFISYISQQKNDKFKVEEKYRKLFDPNYLNVGDQISFKKVSQGLAQDLDIEIFKNGESIGYLSKNIFSRLPYSIRDNVDLFNSIKNETIDQQNQLKQIRDLFFSLPENTTITSTITEKTGGFHLRQSTKQLLSESRLLDDEGVSLLLSDNAGGTGLASEVQFRDSTNEVIRTDNISNFSSYDKAIPKVALWVKYPSNIPNQFNIIPAYVGTIEKDYEAFNQVLTDYLNNNKESLQLIKNELEYDLNKSNELEAFINQYFVYTFNSTNLDNRTNAMSIYNDGGIALKVDGKTTYLKRGQSNKDSNEFFVALKKFSKVANKNITLTSTTKNYKSGINQGSFTGLVFDKGLKLQTYDSYNEYISNYISTDLTKFTNIDNVHYTAPIFKFDQNELLNQLQQKQVKVNTSKEESKANSVNSTGQITNLTPEFMATSLVQGDELFVEIEQGFKTENYKPEYVKFINYGYSTETKNDTGLDKTYFTKTAIVRSLKNDTNYSLYIGRTLEAENDSPLISVPQLDNKPVMTLSKGMPLGDNKIATRRIKFFKDSGKKKRNKSTEFDMNISTLKSIQATRKVLDSLKSFGNPTLKGANSFIIKKQVLVNSDFTKLKNQITKINTEEFNGFPVIKVNNIEVFIDEKALFVYQKLDSILELDRNIVQLYKDVMQSVGISNKSNYLVRIANSTNQTQLSQIIREICK